MSDLLPCPWCSRSPSIEVSDDDDDVHTYWVVCPCGTDGPMFDTCDDAVAAWNNRSLADNAPPPADVEMLTLANRTLAADLARLRCVLAVEQGDASAAPDGWRPSMGEAWTCVARDAEHYTYRITRGRWDWVSRSSRGKVYGRGVAATALEAMEAADRAAKEVSDV